MRPRTLAQSDAVRRGSCRRRARGHRRPGAIGAQFERTASVSMSPDGVLSLPGKLRRRGSSPEAAALRPRVLPAMHPVDRPVFQRRQSITQFCLSYQDYFFLNGHCNVMLMLWQSFSKAAGDLPDDFYTLGLLRIHPPERYSPFRPSPHQCIVYPRAHPPRLLAARVRRTRSASACGAIRVWPRPARVASTPRTPRRPMSCTA